MTTGPRRAMVLAAGFGTRMRPMTETLPKPLLPVAGKPLIGHVLDRLAGAGVERAVVNVHHLAHLIESHLARREGPPGIVISDERDAILDTGGGVARALPYLGDDPFFVHNSDTIWIERSGPVLQTMIDRWDAGTMDTLLLLAPRKTSLGYDGAGDFHMDPAGRLERRMSKTAPHVFAGVSIQKPQALAASPEGAFSLNRIWDEAAAAGRLHGCILDGTWMHVGTPVALAEAERRIARAV